MQMLKPWHLSNLPLQSWAINHFSSPQSWASHSMSKWPSARISRLLGKKNMLSSSSPLASMGFHGLSMRLLQRASTGQQKSKLKATHPRLHSRVGVGVYITYIYLYIHSYLFEKIHSTSVHFKIHVMQYYIVMWGSAMYCIVVQWYDIIRYHYRKWNDMMWYVCFCFIHHDPEILSSISCWFWRIN